MMRLLFAAMVCALYANAGHAVAQQTTTDAPMERVKVAGESASLEWFFLLTEVGNEQRIWAKHSLQPEFTPAALNAVQLKERVDSGAEVGFVNAAEVPLARLNGVPVKTVAGYLGPTVAKIFVAADGPIKTTKDLDRRKMGIVSATHTSARAVTYMNKALGIQAQFVPLGNLEANVAALRSGQIDALYSSEGAALALVDSGVLRLLVPLSEIYPKPYTATVVWATEGIIENKPALVKRFVEATLETVAYIKNHPDYARDLYVKRTKASERLAEKAVASLAQALAPSGRGTDRDLVAAVAGNWQFMTESGAVASEPGVKIETVVDPRFLPGL